MKPIRVVHLIEGTLTAGAARGALWLHQGLRAIGVESSVVTNSRVRVDDPHVEYRTTLPDRVLGAIRHYGAKIPVAVYGSRPNALFNVVVAGHRFDAEPAVRSADVLHVHWVGGGFVNPYALARTGKPIVWTLRDMWAVTGGCHYAVGCERFVDGCGRCPQLGSQRLHDLSWWMARRKQRQLPPGAVLAAISEWLAHEARRSFVTRGAAVVALGNGVSCETFFPVERDAARRAVGIPLGPKRVILVGAQNVEDFYKGFDAFLAALERLDRGSYLVAVFGRGGAKQIEELGFEVRDLGFLGEDSALRNAYSAADVFVAPSRMEAFGKTIAEAMACGRPVVCFDAAGPRDIVDHTVNGYRATPFEAGDLAAGIEWVCTDAARWDDLSRAARAKVMDRFERRVVARSYAALYERVLAGAAERR